MRSHPLKLVVLISGSGSNLQAIIDHIDQGKLDAEILHVFSDNKQAFGLQRAIRAGLTTGTLCRNDFVSAVEHQNALADGINQHDPDLIILAGFMRILLPSFVNRFRGKILNIHPSLLPKFKGLDTHQRALEAGEKRHGATVHFVTAELDSGPVVVQSSVTITDDDTAKTLQQKVLETEHLIYSRAIQWFAEGRITLKGNQVIHHLKVD